MLPRKIYLRSSLPLTTNGKADRRRLVEMAANGGKSPAVTPYADLSVLRASRVSTSSCRFVSGAGDCCRALPRGSRQTWTLAATALMLAVQYCGGFEKSPPASCEQIWASAGVRRPRPVRARGTTLLFCRTTHEGALARVAGGPARGVLRCSWRNSCRSTRLTARLPRWRAGTDRRGGAGRIPRFVLCDAPRGGRADRDPRRA